MPKGFKFNPFGLIGIALFLIVFVITLLVRSGIYLWYFIVSLTIFSLVMIIVVASQEYYQRKRREEQDEQQPAAQLAASAQPDAAPAQPQATAQAVAPTPTAAVQPQAAVQPTAPALPLQDWYEEEHDYEAMLSILWRIKFGSYCTFVILIVNLCILLLLLHIQDIPIILGFFVASVASGMAIPFLLFTQSE